MRKFIPMLCFVCALSTGSTNAQTTIKIDELAQHVGDSVKVATKIYGGKFLDQSQGTPTLLNAGGLYPNALLTLFISPQVRGKFTAAPEDMFKNKDVLITGKVILFKNKPEIVIYEVGQIEIVK